MKAELLIDFRDVADDGAIVALVVWRIPEPVPPSEHPIKYRLVYVVDGVRVLGFDNERGKGDHKHVGAEELPYAFRGVDDLLEDFFAEVEKWKTGR
ncbi:MAG: DUF6516 family protein [Betaproteobacteria bacterium]|nr:DUF6516 family protein [Betaproteobacteria bacterium]